MRNQGGVTGPPRQASETPLARIRNFDCQVIDSRLFIRLTLRPKKIAYVSLVPYCGFLPRISFRVVPAGQSRQIPVEFEGSGKWQ